MTHIYICSKTDKTDVLVVTLGNLLTNRSTAGASVMQAINLFLDLGAYYMGVALCGDSKVYHFGLLVVVTVYT